MRCVLFFVSQFCLASSSVSRVSLVVMNPSTKTVTLKKPSTSWRLLLVSWTWMSFLWKLIIPRDVPPCLVLPQEFTSCAYIAISCHPAQGTRAPFWANSYLLPSNANHSWIKMSEIHTENIVSVVRPCVRATIMCVCLGLLLCSVWISLCTTAGMELYIGASQVQASHALQLGWVWSRFWSWVQGLLTRPMSAKCCVDSIPQGGFGPVEKLHQCGLLI